MERIRGYDEGDYDDEPIDDNNEQKQTIIPDTDVKTNNMTDEQNEIELDGIELFDEQIDALKIFADNGNNWIPCDDMIGPLIISATEEGENVVSARKALLEIFDESFVAQLSDDEAIKLCAGLEGW